MTSFSRTRNTVSSSTEGIRTRARSEASLTGALPPGPQPSRKGYSPGAKSFRPALASLLEKARKLVLLRDTEKARRGEEHEEGVQDGPASHRGHVVDRK